MIRYASLDARAAALLVPMSDSQRALLARGALPTDAERRALDLDARIHLAWSLLDIRSKLREAGLAVIRESYWSPESGAFCERWHVALSRREASRSVARGV